MTHAEWPAELVEALEHRFGRLVLTVPSSGMSVARVWRADFERGVAIVKSSPRARERQFYERVAPALRERGVGIPGVYASLAEGGLTWLAIELLDPLPWPAPDEAPDARVMTTLARLHHATATLPVAMEPATIGAWQPGDTETALGWFDKASAERLMPRLEELGRQARRLADPWCWISGDPSPANWGSRPGRSVALFDWELFRPGVPATDLAITLAGFPASAEFEAVARGYLDACQGAGIPAPWSVAELARDMAVAKLGTMVVLLAGQARGRANVPAAYIERLVAQLPQWLATI
jgi:aminoglycoside phosphotransferase (APT) family kinase protein